MRGHSSRISVEEDTWISKRGGRTERVMRQPAHQQKMPSGPSTCARQGMHAGRSLTFESDARPTTPARTMTRRARPIPSTTVGQAPDLQPAHAQRRAVAWFSCRTEMGALFASQVGPVDWPTEVEHFAVAWHFKGSVVTPSANAWLQPRRPKQRQPRGSPSTAVWLRIQIQHQLGDALSCIPAHVSLVRPTSGSISQRNP